MTRNYLINYLIEEGCFPDEECESDVSQLWHNSNNGHFCYIPCEEELTLTTYCHIFFALKVGPPVDYDADYDVYTSFKGEHMANNVVSEKSGNGKEKENQEGTGNIITGS